MKTSRHHHRHHPLWSDAIAFFVIRKCQKLQKNNENAYTDTEIVHALNNGINFYDIFRKGVIYHNFKSKKKRN